MWLGRTRPPFVLSPKTLEDGSPAISLSLIWPLSIELNPAGDEIRNAEDVIFEGFKTLLALASKMYGVDSSFIDTLKIVNSPFVIYKSSDQGLKTRGQRSLLIDEISRLIDRATTLYKYRQ